MKTLLFFLCCLTTTAAFAQTAPSATAQRTSSSSSISVSETNDTYDFWVKLDRSRQDDLMAAYTVLINDEISGRKDIQIEKKPMKSSMTTALGTVLTCNAKRGYLGIAAAAGNRESLAEAKRLTKIARAELGMSETPPPPPPPAPRWR